jgi:hypothetical protein
MGYMQHHAIVVTVNNYVEEDKDLPTKAADVHEKAVSIFGETMVSNIIKSTVDQDSSFFIGPDGSKEGWEESDEGDEKRSEFVKYLRSLAYDDGSTPYHYAEVQYADDENKSAIVNSSDDDHSNYLKRNKCG